MRKTATCLLVALLCLTSPSASQAIFGGGEKPQPGAAATSFTAPLLGGGELDLGEHLGKAAILLDFWSIYCVACMEEMPKIVELAQRHQESGLLVVGINLDSFGYGRPRFLGTEHALSGLPVHYPASVVAMCDEVAHDRGLIDAGPRTLQVATDGLPFLVRGIPGASVLCFDDHGYMPNYHQMSDTADNLDFGLAWETTGYCRALLLRLAQAG